MRAAASVHERSIREYPEKVGDWAYPKEYKVRYVCRNGAIRIEKANWIFVSTALKGKNIRLEELREEIFKDAFIVRFSINEYTL